MTENNIEHKPSKTPFSELSPQVWQKILLVMIALALLTACDNKQTMYLPQDCGHEPITFRLIPDENGTVIMIDESGQEVFTAGGRTGKVVIDQAGNGDAIVGKLAAQAGDALTIDGYTFTIQAVENQEVVVGVTMNECLE